MAIEHLEVVVGGITLRIQESKTGFFVEKFVRGTGRSRTDHRTYKEAADCLVHDLSVIINSLDPED